MLRPQDTGTRERKNLNGLWSFAPRRGRSRGRSGRPGSPARCRRRAEMAVPAQLQRHRRRRAVRDHVGDVWYQTRCGCRAAGPAQRVVLHFESATHRATVWVDGVEVVPHEGGYTPFEVDVTEHVRARRGGTGHRRGQQHA